MLLESPKSRCIISLLVLFHSLFCSFIYIYIYIIVANFPIYCVCVVRKRPKLKSRYRNRIKATVEYVKMIDDFGNLVDPQTLARHCFGLEPSAFVLRAIAIEEKNECPFSLLLPSFPSFFVLFCFFFFLFLLSVSLSQR